MATSSVTHSFVITKTESIKRFVKALDEADKDRSPKHKLPGRELRDCNEILALMAKRKQVNLSKNRKAVK